MSNLLIFLFVSTEVSARQAHPDGLSDRFPRISIGEIKPKVVNVDIE